MTLVSLIFAILFLFLLMRNINASVELKEYEKGNHGEVLYVMKDTRKRMVVLRIVSALLIVLVVVPFVIDIVKYERFADVDSARVAALVLGLLIFALVPYSTSRWVMTGEGIYVYNSSAFIPWSQMITSGVRRKKNSTAITVSIKKEQGEFMKQTFQILTVPDADADRLCDTIREFIHAIDKMKMLKAIKDEKASEKKKKKTWY